jgi:chromatin segregation and condensation protein Rec8/ScpA/Scc1 (kleisin family)
LDISQNDQSVVDFDPIDPHNIQEGFQEDFSQDLRDDFEIPLHATPSSPPPLEIPETEGEVILLQTPNGKSIGFTRYNPQDDELDDFVVLIEEEASQEISVSPSTSTSKKKKRNLKECWKPEMNSSQKSLSSKTMSRKAKRSLDVDSLENPKKKKKDNEILEEFDLKSNKIYRNEGSPLDSNPETLQIERDPVLQENDSTDLENAPELEDSSFDIPDFEPLGFDEEQIEEPIEEMESIQLEITVESTAHKENLQTQMWKTIEKNDTITFSELLQSNHSFHSTIASNFVALLHLSVKKGLELENKDNDLSDILIKNCNI